MIPVRIKFGELIEAVPPKIACPESIILKLSDERLVPFDISELAKFEKTKNAKTKTPDRTKNAFLFTISSIAQSPPFGGLCFNNISYRLPYRYLC